MRKKNSIVIEKLIEDSACELKLMQADLEGQTSMPHRWSRPIAASGKSRETEAPKIRESY